jgi:transcriptional/translational regulatory protein YebC/TACO1
MEVVVAAGAEEVETALDGSIEVITAPELFDTVRAALAQERLEPEIAQVVQRPATETELEGDDARKVVSLIDALEEMDDVQDVFTNASFPEEMAASG